jgi:hypothetical protein
MKLTLKIQLTKHGTRRHIVHPLDDIYEYGEWWWNDIDRGKLKNSWDKPVPMPLCPPQIPHGLTQAQTGESAVRGRRQTACAMAGPKDTPVMPMENKHNLFPQLIRIPYHNTTFFYSNANSATNTVCIWKHKMVLIHEASPQKLHTWMWVTTQVKYRYSCMSWLLTVYADGGMSRNPHIRHAPLFFILILEKKWMRAMRASTVSRRFLYLFQCCPCA